MSGIDWLPGVFSATAAYIGLVAVVWNQAAKPRSQQPPQAMPNPIYGAFYALYTNSRGRISPVKSVLVTTVWVAFCGGIGFGMTDDGFADAVEEIVEDGVWLLFFVNAAIDFLSVSQTRWLIERLSSRGWGVLLFLLDLALTSVCLVFGTVVLGISLMVLGMSFDWDLVLTVPFRIPYELATGAESGMIHWLVLGAVVSTYSSSFWLAGILIASAGARRRQGVDQMDLVALADRFRTTARLILVVAVTAIYVLVVGIEVGWSPESEEAVLNTVPETLVASISDGL